MKKNDKKYTIANAAGFIFPVTTVYMATYVIDSFQAKEYDLVVCTLFLVSCSVALTIVTGKSYTLTEQGIRHKFWGICYRITPWSDVKDVMNVYVQTGVRGDPPSLVFTTMRGNIYRPDESGYIPKAQRKIFYTEWLCGRIFSIGYPEKHAERFLGFVEKYYGPLDYDFIADYKKAHPKPKEWWKK